MSDAPTAAATPTPVTNGTVTPAPATNGATAPETPAPVRGPDGKFLPKAGTEPKPHEAAPKAAAPPVPELVELVVDGKPRKLTLEQLKARAQKAEGAEARFREAQEAIQKSATLMKEFEEDPEAVLVKLGHDPEKFLARYLEKRAKEAAMSPDEKRLHDAEARAQAAEAKVAAAEKERQEAAQRDADSKTFARLEKNLLTKAKEYGLEQTPKTLELLCQKALEAVEHGYEPTADQLCQDILDEENGRMTKWEERVLAKLTPEQLIEKLGPERIAAIGKATLAQLPAPGQPKKQPAEEAPKKTEKPYIGMAEFLKEFRR